MVRKEKKKKENGPQNKVSYIGYLKHGARFYFHLRGHSSCQQTAEDQLIKNQFPHD